MIVESICFSGGGVRGVAFCGALMALRSWQLSRGAGTHGGGSDLLPPALFPTLKRASGASIGALFACITALRLPSERVFRLLDNEALLDGIIPDVNLSRLDKEFGLDDTTRLRESVLRVLELGVCQWGLPEAEAETLTLSDMHKMTGIDVTISTTRLGRVDDDAAGSVDGDDDDDMPRSVLLSSESAPDITVLQAIVMSMAVPILYKPVTYNGGIFCDGAVLDNAPITSEMNPVTTLVLRLSTRPFDAKDGLQGYLCTVLYSSLHWAEKQKLKNFINQIDVNSDDVGVFEFGAKRERLVAAILDGMVSAFGGLRRLMM